MYFEGMEMLEETGRVGSGARPDNSPEISPEITIVVPVYNSESCLEELVRQIAAHVQQRHQIILVNDRSRDGSWGVIERLAAENETVLGICLRRNAGQDNAIMAGLHHAQGEYVVIMDDDLQHWPGDIDRLYQRCQEGYDVCFANFEEKLQKPWKNLGSWFNGAAATLLLKKPPEIYLSPFKILRRDVVEDMCKYDGPYPYIDGLILSVTDNLTQVDVQHRERHDGNSNYTLFKSFVVWGKHVTGFSIVPLRIASLMGILFSLVGFLFGIYFVLRSIFGNIEVAGWTTLVCLNLFIGGLLLLSLGVIGEYIGRSYLKLNHKPQFVIGKMTTSRPSSSSPASPTESSSE
jgi:polyisoprenyl-phosphate glycosyltransferase